MSVQPTHLSELPEELSDPARLLRDGLRCLHLSGAIFLRADFSTPWAYESPESEQVAQMLRSGDRRVILFHVFTEGRCHLEVSGSGEQVELRGGDIVILP